MSAQRDDERQASPRLRTVAGAAVGFTAIGLLLFVHFFLGKVVEGQRPPFLPVLVDEMTAAWGAGVLFFGIRVVARRFRLDDARALSGLGVHAVALVLFSVLHTSWNWGTRSALYAALGIGPYDYGEMRVRFLMEAPTDVLLYAVMAAGVTYALRLREARERELHAAQLETALERSRLSSLERRLEPHFLFNALNTISSAVPDDPAAAEAMIGHLAALLRTSLRGEERHEVTLREELATLDHYVAFVKARFGDDVSVRVEADPSALDALVPPLLLQPLVENAVRHGRASATGRATVDVAARRDAERLTLSVRDDGDGAGGETGTGLGLTSTAERLRLLHGEAATFRAGSRPGGGFEVTVSFPTRGVTESGR